MKWQKLSSKSNKELSQYTPRMEKIQVDKKDIATVIGKGGANIREIVEVSGAKVDINDSGEVTVSAADQETRDKAIQMINSLLQNLRLEKFILEK